MKKLLVPIATFALIFSSCKTSQLQSYQDDVYANPAEDKKLARIAAAERAKKEADEAAARSKAEKEAALAQKAKDDANPYYQDPQYNQDDYYDYKYASKLRRFQNPIAGAGYYNNYYTNSYMYNQNPSMYGSSIYNSYNMWSPYNQYGNYGSGLSLVFSTGNYFNNPYGYGGYNPYCSNYGYGNSYGGYSPYGYNPYGFNSYGYNSYGNGYNNGFNNGFNWGYFNSYDVNSGYSKMEYGPRGSNGGGNSRQTSAGMIVPEGESFRAQYIHAVNVQQENTPRFTETPQRTIHHANSAENTSGMQTISSEPNKGRAYSSNENTPVNSNPTTTKTEEKQEGFWPRVFGNTNTNSSPVNNNATASPANPVRGTNSNPEKIKASSFENNNFNNSGNSERNFNSGNSTPINSGGTSTPRGGGGGGSNHPR